MRWDMRVHRSIYRAAGNPHLEDTLVRYDNLATRIFCLFLDRHAGLRPTRRRARRAAARDRRRRRRARGDAGPRARRRVREGDPRGGLSAAVSHVGGPHAGCVAESARPSSARRSRPNARGLPIPNTAVVVPVASV